MGRMINLKLLDYFDKRGMLSTLQCGGRPTGRKAQANNELVSTVCFDMERCGDSWKKAHLQTKLFKPISFRVNVNEVLSDTKSQTGIKAMKRCLRTVESVVKRITKRKPLLIILFKKNSLTHY